MVTLCSCRRNFYVAVCSRLILAVHDSWYRGSARGLYRNRALSVQFFNQPGAQSHSNMRLQSLPRLTCSIESQGGSRHTGDCAAMAEQGGVGIVFHASRSGRCLLVSPAPRCPPSPTPPPPCDCVCSHSLKANAAAICASCTAAAAPRSNGFACRLPVRPFLPACPRSRRIVRVLPAVCCHRACLPALSVLCVLLHTPGEVAGTRWRR